jgi:hypothetical protein
MPRPQFHARVATLLERLADRPGVVEWRVELDDGELARAVAYPFLSGSLQIGGRVWLNTTAVELGLGTGGTHFVLAPLDVTSESGEDEIGQPPARSAGHLMKLRYTPLQHAVLAVEEEASPYRTDVESRIDLEGLPVIAAELHSTAMAAAVAAGVCGAHRVVYVMTDGAALPLPISRLAGRLRAEGVLTATITAGQAFGGDMEAVTVASALTAARAVFDPDLVIVSQGPGNAGTGTRFGFSGLGQAEHLHAAAVLGGRPVAALRISFADPRPRHRGLSHHTATVLGRMLLTRVAAAVPELSSVYGDSLRKSLVAADLPLRHELRLVPADDLLSSLEPYREVLTTMGRTIEEDRAFFLAACAAARLALDPDAGHLWPFSPEDLEP